MLIQLGMKQCMQEMKLETQNGRAMLLQVFYVKKYNHIRYLCDLCFNISFEFSIKELQFRHCFPAVLIIEVLQGSKE